MTTKLIGVSLLNLLFKTNYNRKLLRTIKLYSHPARMSVFKGQTDRFNGVTVDSSKENCTIDEFKTKLEDSLKLWIDDNKRGIWFKVYLEQSEWIPFLAKQGFNFHHAKNDFVMMYRWLPEEICNIPAFATNLIGVGGVIVNEKSQILVVNEKNIQRPHWKLPGGYLEPGEDIIDGLKREVFEETSIETEFKSLLTFRHTHQGMFGCSDVYIVLHMKPLTSAIKISEQELSNCRWMDLEEYLSHPHIHSLNKFFVKKYLEYQKNGIKIECTDGMHDILKYPYKVYHATKE